MGNLKAKVALVTDASHGIERTITVRLARGRRDCRGFTTADLDAVRETLATID